MWCQVTLYLVCSVSFEIFYDKLSVVHLEIVLNILQGRMIIFYHQIGIFAYNMHLLDFQLVEFVEHPIVVLLVSRLVVLYSLDIHGIIKYQKSAFKF